MAFIDPFLFWKHEVCLHQGDKEAINPQRVCVCLSRRLHLHRSQYSMMMTLAENYCHVNITHRIRSCQIIRKSHVTRRYVYGHYYV